MDGQGRGGEWTTEFFGGLWLDLQRRIHPPEHTARQVEQLWTWLGLEPGQRVLDAPCGEGRIALALAERGADVVGIDQSEALLADARRQAAQQELLVEFRQLDLREADRLGSLDGDPFDLVLNVWGSFGYFGDGGLAAAADPDLAGGGDLAFARAVASLLRPGGRFLIDCPSIETLMARYAGRGWGEGGGVRALEDRAWDPIEGVMHVQWTLVGPEQDGRSPVEIRHTHMRIYSVPELCRLLVRAGFVRFEIASDMAGSPWKPGDRMVLLAVR